MCHACKACRRWLICRRHRCTRARECRSVRAAAASCHARMACRVAWRMAWRVAFPRARRLRAAVPCHARRYAPPRARVARQTKDAAASVQATLTPKAARHRRHLWRPSRMASRVAACAAKRSRAKAMPLAIHRTRLTSTARRAATRSARWCSCQSSQRRVDRALMARRNRSQTTPRPAVGDTGGERRASSATSSRRHVTTSRKQSQCQSRRRAASSEARAAMAYSRHWRTVAPRRTSPTGGSRSAGRVASRRRQRRSAAHVASG